MKTNTPLKYPFADFLNKSKINIDFVSDDEIFEIVWQNFILNLRGKTIYTFNGKRNILIEINNTFIVRKSSNNKESKILKSELLIVFQELLKYKKLHRNEINNLISFKSSIVTMILAELPFITAVRNPTIQITLL